jgi:DNA-binding response OmpR family regulator
VLVVEDEPAIADVIRLNLVKAGYGVHVESSGDTALDAVHRLKPAAIILDVGLPGIDGVEVCRRLRASENWTPVLFVTARDDEVDRIVGLTLGGLTLDIAQHRVFRGEEELALTATEFDLLAYLIRRPGRVVTREQLLSEVWGYSAVAGTRTVDVHIAQLRAKLGAASPIRTVRGVGYSAE